MQYKLEIIWILDIPAYFVQTAYQLAPDILRPWTHILNIFPYDPSFWGLFLGIYSNTYISRILAFIFKKMLKLIRVAFVNLLINVKFIPEKLVISVHSSVLTGNFFILER